MLLAGVGCVRLNFQRVYVRGKKMMELYLWVKAFHVIAVISWMAGMLYLPRLYVYHTGVEVGSDMDKTFQIMEHRLLRYIINPAMIVTFILGIWLIFIVGFENLNGWFHVKLALVLLMAAVHGFLARCRKKFLHGKNTYSITFYRILNEVPTLLMVIIVILVIVKPF